jgi:hypothetical protein
VAQIMKNVHEPGILLRFREVLKLGMCRKHRVLPLGGLGMFREYL